jgi:flagellar P-ring protein precursor FlgI
MALAAGPAFAENEESGDTSIPPKTQKAGANASQAKPQPKAGPAMARSGGAAETAPTAGLVRIKDIADMQGVRGNQLIGYGLVVGLDGTGDGQSSQFTIQGVVNMLRKLGVVIPADTVKVKNVAAVIVTADLPAFVKTNSKIDVTVSSMGDAKSLQGGTLLRTPLLGPDGEMYASAQGPLSIGGFNFGQGGSSVQKNHVAVGRVPRGAYVEREVPVTLSDGSLTQLTLREPDFTTANRVAEAIRKQLPGVDAQAQDAATVSVQIPADQSGNLIRFLSRVENVSVTPDTQARIIINERTGTVVISGDVRLAPGAIDHGAINVRIENNPIVVPSPSFTKNPPPPLVVPQKDTKVEEKSAQLAAIPATTTVDQLVRALNALGVTPRDLISILQGMHAAGMISAEIVVQ